MLVGTVLAGNADSLKSVTLQVPDQAMVMLSALESTSVGAAGVAGGGEHRYCSVSSKNREANKARDAESAPPGEAEVPRRKGAGSGLAVGSHPHLRSQSGSIPSPIGPSHS